MQTTSKCVDHSVVVQKFTMAGTTQICTMSHSNADTNGAVHFEEGKSEKKEERKKYLTMKYGQHQIRLIQKRLKVEFWVDGELNDLYGITDPNETYPCELDLDEILDLETDDERRNHILELVRDCGRPRVVVEKFVKDVLEQVATL